MTPVAMTPARDLDPQELGVTARPLFGKGDRIVRSGSVSTRLAAPAARDQAQRIRL
jgi:hypothetical protein